MRRKMLLFAGLLVVILVALQQVKSINVFVAQVQNHTSKHIYLDPDSAAMPVWVPISEQQPSDPNELRATIEIEAAKRRVAPINARVDSVWKAIPGYNGVEVNVSKSFALSNENRKGPIRYVMEEIEPEIGLDDLGPYPIYKGNPQKPMVGLMINVAWGNEFLPSMLKTLKEENVHATFFFDGSWLKKNIETAKLIQQEGHELANHAYSHKKMSQLSRDQAKEEIMKTQELLQSKLEVSNTLFAPPSGDFNQETVLLAHELKLKTILWTLDTIDWMNPGPKKILQKVESRVEPGSLILMHPTDSSSRALADLIRTVKRKGLTPGTVSEVLSSKRI